VILSESVCILARLSSVRLVDPFISTHAMEAATRADECSHGRRHHRDSDRDRRQELEKEGKTEGNEESARNVLLAEAGDRIKCVNGSVRKKKGKSP